MEGKEEGGREEGREGRGGREGGKGRGGTGGREREREGVLSEKFSFGCFLISGDTYQEIDKGRFPPLRVCITRV